MPAVPDFPRHQAFLAERAGPVDRVIAIPRCRGVGEPEDFVNDTDALDQFFAEMLEERFDLVIQLHGGGRYSNPLVHRLQSRFTVGLKALRQRPSTVGIYWCFNLVNAGSLGRTLHRPQLSWQLECPVCGVNCLAGHCDHDASFVADVPVEQVTASAIELLSVRAQSSDGVNAVP